MSVMSTAYERLRERVVAGDVALGERLAEVPLAADLGVSRATVREALRRLESEGLIQPDGRSLRVAAMDERELHSALLMRASLEALHAELAAERVGLGEVAPAALRRLRERADAAERATDAGDYDRAARANRSFHQAIDALADSPVSARAVDQLWDRLVVTTRQSLRPPGRGAVVNEEHRQLIAAIEAADGSGAATIAMRHVRATMQVADDSQAGVIAARSGPA
jgi:DNA-binding GntR family transcriptional regulator